MAKKIFIFYDGTWCGDTAHTCTNIKRLADTAAGRVVSEERMETIANGSVLIYYRGVGLNGQSIFNYLVDGAISLEVKEDCVKMYKFIVDNYNLDDEVWVFGLSRGAYIVRSVAGLINNCGILRRENRSEDEIQSICRQFYGYYKNRDENYRPDRMRGQLRRMCHDTNRPAIKFMGLIDTVGALGIPKIDPERGISYEFYDQIVPSEVENVYQASSIHDRLSFFAPCSIKRDENTRERYGGVVHYRTEEVWFPGAHYDLGDQFFTFGANFGTDDMYRGVDGVTSRLLTILNNNLPISRSFDWLKNKLVLWGAGEFTKKILSHYLGISGSTTIEANPVYANQVYEWMFEKMREIDTNYFNGQVPQRDRIPALLNGDVYEEVLNRFDLTHFRDIVLRDRIIQPLTPRENVREVDAPGYASRTFETYNLINRELTAHIEEVPGP